MKTIRLILGDQLNFGITSLSDINPNKDLILMAELNEEATYVKHHKKKIKIREREDCILNFWAA